MGKAKKIMYIIILILLIPILIISTTLIIQGYINKDEVPNIFGYSPLIVLSGSMEPKIHTGDLIIVKKISPETLKKDDVIAFFIDSSKKTIVTHRIVEIIEKNGERTFITKGDNNNTNDEDEISSSLVVGKYQNIRFSGLGNAAMYMQTTTGMIATLSIPVCILIIAQYAENKKNKKELEQLRKTTKE